jgi:hypothetical protein
LNVFELFKFGNGSNHFDPAARDCAGAPPSSPTSPVRAHTRRPCSKAPPHAHPCWPRGVASHLPLGSGRFPFPSSTWHHHSRTPLHLRPPPPFKWPVTAGLRCPQISPARRLARPPSAASLTVCPSRPIGAPPSKPGPSRPPPPSVVIVVEAPSSCCSSPIPGCETHPCPHLSCRTTRRSPPLTSPPPIERRCPEAPPPPHRCDVTTVSRCPTLSIGGPPKNLAASRPSVGRPLAVPPHGPRTR